MERTLEGKVLVYKQGGFERPNGLQPSPHREFWPVDAREIVGSDPATYSYTPFDVAEVPDDVDKLPPSPFLSKTVDVPVNPVVAKAGTSLEDARNAGELAPGVPLIPGGVGLPSPTSLKPPKA